jgi:hypothetical protein
MINHSVLLACLVVDKVKGAAQAAIVRPGFA